MKFSILNPSFLKDTLVKVDVYGQLINQGIPALLSSTEKNSEFGLGGLMKADDIGEIIKSAIPVSFLQEQTEKTIDGFLNFALGKTQKMEIIIPLAEFKKTSSEKFTEKLNAKIQELPKCTQKEFQELQNSKEGEEVKSFNCWPAGMEGELFSESLIGSITGSEGFLTKLPDQYNLGEVIVKDSQKAEAIQRFFTIFNKVFQTLWIALLVIVALIILINRRYPAGMLKWIAIPILIPSAIILLFSLAGGIFAKLLTMGYMGMLPADFKQVASSLQDAIISRFSYNFILFSGISVAICIVLLIVSSIINRKSINHPTH